MDTEFLIVGGGMAGASIAFFLSRHAQVIVLERESQPGYHTTGRSAALFAESYGTEQVRALTVASRPFFESPPDGFAEAPLLTSRGALFVGTPAQTDDLDALFVTLGRQSDLMRRLDAAATLELVPVLEPARLAGGVLDPLAADMDVHAIHQGFLRGVRSRGGTIVVNADVTGIAREGGRWRIEAGGQSFTAGVLVNAAGAWADTVAAMAGVAPIGLVPKRRSAFTFDPPDVPGWTCWPTVIGVDESFYFKPDAGQMLGSPANADPVAPHDVQAEEEDIATGIWRIEEATSLRIRRPRHTWAGLRSFVADGDLVGGFDAAAPGFFWCAAQGGYGIQTAPAMGEVCAALALGRPMPSHLAAFGLTREMLAPDRPALRIRA